MAAQRRSDPVTCPVRRRVEGIDPTDPQPGGHSQMATPSDPKPFNVGNTIMRIGVSIFLIAVGAILTFAVHATIAGLDLQVVGWILMLVGAAGLAIFLYWNRRRAPAPS